MADNSIISNLVLQRDYTLQDRFAVTGIFTNANVNSITFYIRYNIQEDPFLMVWMYTFLLKNKHIIPYKKLGISDVVLWLATENQSEIIMAYAYNQTNNDNIMLDSRYYNYEIANTTIDVTEYYQREFSHFKYRYGDWLKQFSRCTLRVESMEGSIYVGLFGENSIDYPVFEHEYWGTLSNLEIKDCDKIRQFIVTIIYILSYPKIDAYIRASQEVVEPIEKILRELQAKEYIQEYKVIMM